MHPLPAPPVPRPLLIVAATPMELAALVRRTNISLPALQQGDAFTHADFLFAPCGVGPVNAALAAGRLLERHQPRGVVLAGIAGSFDLTRHPIGALCLITEEIWPEYGLAGARGVHARSLGFPQAEIDGQPVWDRLAWDAPADAHALGVPDPLCHLPTARGLTVAGVTGTPRRAASLLRRFAPDLEHMEGFPFALACRQAGLPFVQLRSVSNPVGVRDKAAWNIPAALQALAEAGERIWGGRREEGKEGEKKERNQGG